MNFIQAILLLALLTARITHAAVDWEPMMRVAASIDRAPNAQASDDGRSVADTLVEDTSLWTDKIPLSPSFEAGLRCIMHRQKAIWVLLKGESPSSVYVSDTNRLVRAAFNINMRHIQTPNFLWGGYVGIEGLFPFNSNQYQELWSPNKWSDEGVFKINIGFDTILLPLASKAKWPLQVTPSFHYTLNYSSESTLNNLLIPYDKLGGAVRIAADQSPFKKYLLTLYYRYHDGEIDSRRDIYHNFGIGVGIEQPVLKYCLGSCELFWDYQAGGLFWRAKLQLDTLNANKAADRSLQSYLKRDISKHVEPIVFINDLQEQPSSSPPSNRSSRSSSLSELRRGRSLCRPEEDAMDEQEVTSLRSQSIPLKGLTMPDNSRINQLVARELEKVFEAPADPATMLPQGRDAISYALKRKQVKRRLDIVSMLEKLDVFLKRYYKSNSIVPVKLKKDYQPKLLDKLGTWEKLESSQCFSYLKALIEHYASSEFSEPPQQIALYQAMQESPEAFNQCLVFMHKKYHGTKAENWSIEDVLVLNALQAQIRAEDFVKTQKAFHKTFKDKPIKTLDFLDLAEWVQSHEEHVKEPLNKKVSDRSQLYPRKAEKQTEGERGRSKSRHRKAEKQTEGERGRSKSRHQKAEKQRKQKRDQSKSRHRGKDDQQALDYRSSKKTPSVTTLARETFANTFIFKKNPTTADDTRVQLALDQLLQAKGVPFDDNMGVNAKLDALDKYLSQKAKEIKEAQAAVASSKKQESLGVQKDQAALSKNKMEQNALIDINNILGVHKKLKEMINALPEQHVGRYSAILQVVEREYAEEKKDHLKEVALKAVLRDMLHEADFTKKDEKYIATREKHNVDDWDNAVMAKIDYILSVEKRFKDKNIATQNELKMLQKIAQDVKKAIKLKKQLNFVGSVKHEKAFESSSEDETEDIQSDHPKAPIKRDSTPGPNSSRHRQARQESSVNDEDSDDISKESDQDLIHPPLDTEIVLSDSDSSHHHAQKASEHGTAHKKPKDDRGRKPDRKEIAKRKASRSSTRKPDNRRANSDKENIEGFATNKKPEDGDRGRKPDRKEIAKRKASRSSTRKPDNRQANSDKENIKDFATTRNPKDDDRGVKQHKEKTRAEQKRSQSDIYDPSTHHADSASVPLKNYVINTASRQKTKKKAKLSFEERLNTIPPFDSQPETTYKNVALCFKEYEKDTEIQPYLKDAGLVVGEASYREYIEFFENNPTLYTGIPLEKCKHALNWDFIKQELKKRRGDLWSLYNTSFERQHSTDWDTRDLVAILCEKLPEEKRPTVLKEAASLVSKLPPQQDDDTATAYSTTSSRRKSRKEDQTGRHPYKNQEANKSAGSIFSLFSSDRGSRKSR